MTDKHAGFQLEAGTFDAMIFDCDGTLVETGPAHLAALNASLEPDGISMEPDWYFARAGLTPTALLDDFEAEFQPLPRARASIFGDYGKYYLEQIALVNEVRAVAEIARTWHGRVPMAVASNGDRENVLKSLETVGLLGLFPVIVVAADVAKGKPAPDIYLESARRLAVAPHRCLVFEDSDEGLEAAQLAGMRTIDVRAEG